jgi:hypothetical protein
METNATIITTPIERDGFTRFRVYDGANFFTVFTDETGFDKGDRVNVEGVLRVVEWASSDFDGAPMTAVELVATFCEVDPTSFEWCNTDSPAKHRAPKGSTKPFDGNGVNLCPKCTQSTIDELNGIDPEERAGIDADEIALCEYCKTVHLYWTSDYCRARELAGDEHAPHDEDTLLKCPTCHEVHRNTAEVVERHRH